MQNLTVNYQMAQYKATTPPMRYQSTQINLREFLNYIVDFHMGLMCYVVNFDVG